MHAADDLIRQGRLARFEGRVEEALGLYQTAAELFKEENDEPRWANTMRYVAALEVELKRGEDARRDIEAVLALHTALKPLIPTQQSVMEVANATRVAALAAEACGEHDRAKQIWREAAELYAEARLLDGSIEEARELAMHPADHDESAMKVS
jgi:tetratricopeptide (TPR) repeat protein